jgi:ABC-type antimicrobial peptide transport system permease subunit
MLMIMNASADPRVANARAGAGALLGLLIAVPDARLLRGLLVGVDAIDWFTYLTVVVAVGVVTLRASCIPARRAATVDPLTLLRE